MSTIKKVTKAKKVKIDPIQEAIKKAKYTLEQRKDDFKKPFPVTALTEANKPASIYDKQRKNLGKNLQVLQKKTVVEEKSHPQLPIDILAFLSLPPLLSPIKKSRKLVLNPFSKPNLQMKIIDAEMKSFIEIFAKNIENLAKGDTYKQMNIPETEDFEDIFIGKKRRSKCNQIYNVKRQKLVKS